MSGPQLTIYTIGHSNHSAEAFISLLTRHRIEAVADVRSSPYSQFAPHFNREPLKAHLQSAGIAYVFLGDELGARRKERHCYLDGRVSYERVAREPLFLAGLGRVESGAQRYRLVLLCAEKDPLDCHRTILVARQLVARGHRVTHILADGSVERHEASEARLLQRLSLPEADWFRSPSELLELAYARQAEQIAFVEAEQPQHTVAVP